jgi:hypothetical protein
VGLFLLGLEVAIGVVSLSASRLGEGLRAAVSGDEFLVSAPRYLSGLALMLVAAALYGGVRWAERVKREVIVSGELCPKCGNVTRRVRRRSWQRAVAKVFDVRVTRRYCEGCGWSGLAT